MNETNHKRQLARAYTLLALAAAPIGHAMGNDDAAKNHEMPEITVYKSATCGCCSAWIDYLEDRGFEVEAINHDNLDAVKAANGLTDPGLKSCHTALIDGYVIEGHVPAQDIEKLLAERPDVVGLTAPGMPVNSPGMNSIEPKDYTVYAFDEKGEVTEYSKY